MVGGREASCEEGPAALGSCPSDYWLLTRDPSLLSTRRITACWPSCGTLWHHPSAGRWPGWTPWRTKCGNCTPSWTRSAGEWVTCWMFFSHLLWVKKLREGFTGTERLGGGRENVMGWFQFTKPFLNPVALAECWGLWTRPLTSTSSTCSSQDHMKIV